MQKNQRAERRAPFSEFPELQPEPTLQELHALISRAEAALAQAKLAASVGDAARAEAALSDASSAHDLALALRRDLATR